jgi:hypothetical protein
MTPLKPEQVEKILKERPDVTREHIREYERLTGEWLRSAQHPPKDGEGHARHAARIERIEALHQRLFG